MRTGPRSREVHVAAGTAATARRGPDVGGPDPAHLVAVARVGGSDGFRLHTPAENGGWSQCQGISVADTEPTSTTSRGNAEGAAGIPGSASSPHPTDAIPLPEHGFAPLDDVPVRDLADIPAVEVITRAAVMLMSAAAEKLGLAPDGEPHVDLDEARRLITALAGLVSASQEHLGIHRQPLREGLRALQNAFREASSYPDPPGEGPGEKFIR